MIFNNIVCLVAEFNPFHNGHKFLIDSIKKDLNPDLIAIILSGSFTQRGDLAVADKFTRAEWGIKAGADVVFELPTIYSLSNAKIFADGAIRTLSSIFTTYTLAFGSESGDISVLKNISDSFENEITNKQIKEYLKLGYSYAKSCELSLKNIDKTFWTGNNILGVEYINSIKRMASDINLYTIARNLKLASSTEIRNNLKPINENVPEFVKYETKDVNLVYEKLALYLLNSKNPDELNEILNVKEGLNYKLAKEQFKSLDEFYSLTSKRLTLSTLKRLAASVVLNIRKKDLETLQDLNPYTTILAINEKLKNKILSFCANSKCHLLYKASDNIDNRYSNPIKIDNNADLLLRTLLR